MKKTVSLLLSIAMLLSITAGLNLNAYAYSSYKTGNCGENVTYSLEETQGILTIDGTGDTYDYYEENGDVSIYTSPFRNSSNIKNVIIKSGVTNIVQGLFYNCKKLEYIEIPKDVTSISRNAFYLCSGLKRIKYNGTKSNWYSINGSGNVFAVIKCTDGVITKNSDVSVNAMTFTIYDDYTAIFSGCENPTESVTIPSSVSYFDYNFKVYAIADGAFMNCSGVKNVIIPSGVQILCEGAFMNCADLKNITIPESVTIIGAIAFDGCKNLLTVNYGGTMAQWKQINIDSDGNDALYSAAIKCSDGIINKHIHSFSSDWKIISPATCVSRGVLQNTCDTCGETVTQYTSVNPNAHDFSNNTQTCLNGCGTANLNYVAPIPNPTPSSAPTQPTTTTTTTAAKSASKPKSASVKKVKAVKKAVSVEWKKVSGVNGYEIQVATDKKFKKNKKTATIKKQKTTKTTVKKLKAKKKYYVRIRTYKTVNGKKIYSSWSKVKSVKTK